MKIKIIKPSGHSWWYDAHIGETFTVSKVSQKSYGLAYNVLNGERPEYFVLAKHCEVVEGELPNEIWVKITKLAEDGGWYSRKESLNTLHKVLAQPHRISSTRLMYSVVGGSYKYIDVDDCEACTEPIPFTPKNGMMFKSTAGLYGIFLEINETLVKFYWNGNDTNAYDMHGLYNEKQLTGVGGTQGIDEIYEGVTLPSLGRFLNPTRAHGPLLWKRF